MTTSAPIWQTPAGSLGTIPEENFYQVNLLAVANLVAGPVAVTATSAVNNAITCDDTTGIEPTQVVNFFGKNFGGLQENVNYYVLEVLSDTEFTIVSEPRDTTPMALTTATGIMTAEFFPRILYKLVAGTLPKGMQIAETGYVAGVPKAVTTASLLQTAVSFPAVAQVVANLQGVPNDVAQNVTSKFTIRAYTPDSQIADRTFTITVTGNDVPQFITPAGAFASVGTAQFAGSIVNNTLTVNEMYTGEILPGMVIRGDGIWPGTIIKSFLTGSGSTGTYTVNIAQTIASSSITATAGIFYDGDEVYIPIQYTTGDPNETTTVSLIAGSLPLGLSISSEGVISGYIRPTPNETEPVGYDLTPIGTVPYDFIVSAISKNYQFTLEVSDGKSSSIRTFSIYVYNREDLTADDTLITADNTFVTADETPERAPFLLNGSPTDLGRVRGDNYFAYRFIGQDFDTRDLEYTISVNQGSGLPEGLELDPYSGWYYGYIPYPGATEITYSFNIQVRSRSLRCTATEAGTNLITADTTLRTDFAVGDAVTFDGTTFGNVSSNVTYYVVSIPSNTTFQVSTTLSGTPITLTTATGTMFCVPPYLPRSQLYPYTLTVVGVLDDEITWLTDSNLGSIENGSVSTLKVEAYNRGNRELLYRLKSGAYNQLPQGLKLLPTGEIAGHVSFDTFSIDLGTTTFDATQSNITKLDPTTFDSTYEFTVEAYAPDTTELLYKVTAINVLDGGSGYGTGGNVVVEISSPAGASALPAVAGIPVLSSGAIIDVPVTDTGSGYTSPATITITEPYGGSGADLQAVMTATGYRDIVNSSKTFTVRVIRAYNTPYQNLFVLAMPPQDDRALVRELLNNTEIFQPEYIYRADDPNFGKSVEISYQHAFGLGADTLDKYVESLYKNHYWKNLVLGEISTAQAIDPVTGKVLYEVVYSKVIDDLVNSQGQSVSKIVNLPYDIIDPADGSTLLGQVYPNSLVNMRDQVIDTVGQVSTKLPLWMTSKQTNGRVLGFTPAWVICYTNPGYSARVAYYINTYFGQRLNLIDFKVDRYELDTTATRNWDPVTQQWTPTPNLTTFDRLNTAGFTDMGIVQACTELSWDDVADRNIDYINSLGGLDGQTWVTIPGQVPPPGTKVSITTGDKLIFVKQENYNNGKSLNNNWTKYLGTYDSEPYSSADFNTTPGAFDYSVVIPGGYDPVCYATDASTDYITCDTTLDMNVGDKLYFTGSTFGNIDRVDSQGYTQVYYASAVKSVTCTATNSVSDNITTADTSELYADQPVWFDTTTIGDISPVEGDGLSRQYYISAVTSPTTFQISDTIGGLPLPLSTDSGTMVMYLDQFQVSQTLGGPTVGLATETGTMNVHYNNVRMAIYEVTIGLDFTIHLTPYEETVANDYVTSSQGQKYAAGTYLYRPVSPQQSLTRVNWQPLISATTVVSTQTTFDQNSLQFVEPVDMYEATDRYDKYLVFPKANILV